MKKDNNAGEAPQTAFKMNLDDFARDIAFEIQLGGDRFGPDDVRDILRGIPRKDLQEFRDRIEYHAVDFAPVFIVDNNEFVREYIDKWLSGVQTAETLGVEPQIRFSSEGLLRDRGEFFVCPDLGHDVVRCPVATRYLAWQKDGRPREVVDLYRKVTPAQACDLLVEKLFKDFASGKDRIELLSMDFPMMGRAKALTRQGDKLLVEFVEGVPAPLLSVAAKDGNLADELIRELDEQTCNEHNLIHGKGDYLQLLRKRADVLLDNYGSRVRSDFLYDDVDVVDHLSTESALPRITIRRSVDDLSPDSRSHYVLYTAGGVKKMVEFGSLSFEKAREIGARIDDELEYRVTAEFLTEGLVLENGPMVCIPFASNGNATMVVDSVFSYNGEVLMVSGRPGGDREAAPKVMRLDELSDNGVQAVRNATDNAIRRILANSEVEPVRKMREKRIEAMKASGKDVRKTAKKAPRAPRIG